MDRVKFVRDCLTDLIFLQDKTVTKENKITDDRYVVMDYIRANYSSMLLRLEKMNIFILEGLSKPEILDNMFDGISKVVAREMTWIKGYENEQL